jgi:hypothetical protein
MVDVARVLDRGSHGGLGDGVEGDALNGLALQRLLLIERFQHVPGDGFAFAIRVGGEDEAIGVFEGVGDVLDVLAGLGIDLPIHREVLVGLHRTVLGGQVADVAVGGQDLIVRAQILVDCLGLSRGLDDDDVHAGTLRANPGPKRAGNWGRDPALSTRAEEGSAPYLGCALIFPC